MKPSLGRYVRGQEGYTLVELIVASAIGLAVMTGLTSVVLTSWRASVIATNRIEAGSEIRNFQLTAYDDFAGSSVPGPSSCVNSPCTQPIVLSGVRVNGAPYQVTYSWDGTAVLNRQLQGQPNPQHVALDVTGFSWYVDSPPTGHPTVVVNLTVTIGNPSGLTYSESQTLRFYPRLT